MPDPKGALASFSVSSSARVLRATTRIGALLLATRLYPIDQVGEFAFSLGVGTLTAGILDFGITDFLQRELGALRFETAALERRALYVRLTTLPFSLVIGWVIIRLFSPTMPVAAVGTLLFAASIAMADFLSGVWRARGRFGMEAAELVPVLLGGLGAGLVVGLLGGDVEAFQWAAGISAGFLVLVRTLILMLRLNRGIDTNGAASQTTAELMLRARWFWLASVGSLFLFEAPVVLLRWLGDAQAVALFAASMRAAGFASQPFLVLGAVFLPSMAFQASEGRKPFIEAVRHLNTIFLVAAPGALLLAVGGGGLLLIAFGPQYAEATGVLWSLAIGTLLYLGAPHVGPLLIAGCEKGVAGIVAIAGLVTGILCVILIPEVGALGAGIASACGFLTGKVCHIALYRSVGLPPGSARWWVAAVGVMIWAGLSVIVSPPLESILLIGGGLLSAACAIPLLLRTRLFEMAE